jgi:hypothetical protein
MDAEKIFWALVVLAIAGFTLFLAFGGLVAPVNAGAPGAYLQPSGVQLGQQNAQQPLGNGLFAAQPVANAQPSGGQLAPVKNGVQEITLSVQGATYMPNPIRVKKGIPVKITADLSSVRGCASSIVIPEFNVRKSFRQGDNSAEFTPDKSGTFDFGCSMWMYRGKILVEENDGTVAAYQGAAPAPSGSTCGAGGGGCGCGGGKLF